jgi:hypothetical protein
LIPAAIAPANAPKESRGPVAIFNSCVSFSGFIRTSVAAATDSKSYHNISSEQLLIVRQFQASFDLEARSAPSFFTALMSQFWRNLLLGSDFQNLQASAANHLAKRLESKLGLC